MEVIDSALIALARQYFVESYFLEADLLALKAETLGLYASKEWGDFNGEAIALIFARALASGLEDANWHTEAGVFYDWIERLEAGERIGEILGVRPGGVE